MRGMIESAAIKSIIYTSGYKGLPSNADDMIQDYLALHGVSQVAGLDRLFQALAIRRTAGAVRPQAADLVARRIKAD